MYHQAPENEHQAAQNHPSNQAEKATAQGITPRRLKDTEKENRPRNHPRRKISNKLLLAFLTCNPGNHPLLKEDEDESPEVLKPYQ